MLSAHRWVLEARFPALRKVFRGNVQSDQLDLKRFPTSTVARLYCQKIITDVIAFSLKCFVLFTGWWRQLLTTLTQVD